jgi:medium-chain acyl-[acyl-carrier-protein] hydrolase
MTLNEKGNYSARHWFSCAKLNRAARLRMFCFPYGGGGSAIYNTWPRSLPAFMEVYSAHLPGHGQRFSEPLITHMATLVEMLTRAIQPYLDKPFVFFGHSMGALISFELARHLRRNQIAEPVYLFVSGLPAPQIPKTTRLVHELTDSELTKELNNLGTSKDLLESVELMEMVLPIIRADYKLIETYSYKEEPPLTYPIMAFGGTCDNSVSREHLEEWKEQTKAAFGLRMIPGDHFFIHTEESRLLKFLSNELNRFS